MSKTPVVGLVVPDPNAEGRVFPDLGNIVLGSKNLPGCPGIVARPEKERLNIGVPKPEPGVSVKGAFLDAVILQTHEGLLQSARLFHSEFYMIVQKLEAGKEPFGLNPNLSYRLSDLLIQYQKLESLKAVADLVDK